MTSERYVVCFAARRNAYNGVHATVVCPKFFFSINVRENVELWSTKISSARNSFSGTLSKKLSISLQLISLARIKSYI